MKWAKWIVLWVSVVLALSGCGRNLPVLTAEQLQNKLTVLVVTGTDMQEPLATTLQKTLAAWRDTKQISYEWMQKTDSFSAEQVGKLQQRPYDYIIVLGHTPVQGTLAAAKALPAHKWIFIDDGLGAPQGDIVEKHIVYRGIPSGRVQQEWDEWVKQQQVSGRAIEWVTNAANPIPSAWAPSEEAETISLTDANGWYPQFQSQVRSHGPSWIVLYSPVDPSTIQRMKNLQVPIMNMAATSVQLQWDVLLSSLQRTMETKSWTPGFQPFAEGEMRVSKNS